MVILPRNLQEQLAHTCFSHNLQFSNKTFTSYSRLRFLFHSKTLTLQLPVTLSHHPEINFQQKSLLLNKKGLTGLSLI